MFFATTKKMGTEIELAIPRDNFFDQEKAKFITGKVFALFERYENIFSRFDETSELSRLNRGEISQVSEPFFELFLFSILLAEKTNGIFNPLVNLSSIGYSSDFFSGEFSQKKEEFSLDFSKISFDKEKREILLPKNEKLDFGASAKGFTVDAAVKIFDEFFPNFCIGAGGDLFARGKFHGEKWEIGIADPSDESRDFEILKISNAAVATSGSYRRNWKINEKSFHHLVSGKTNKNPHSGVSSVTVIAKSALEADAFATTAFLLGEKLGKDFLEKNNARGAFL